VRAAAHCGATGGVGDAEGRIRKASTHRAAASHRSHDLLGSVFGILVQARHALPLGRRLQARGRHLGYRTLHGSRAAAEGEEAVECLGQIVPLGAVSHRRAYRAPQASKIDSDPCDLNHTGTSAGALSPLQRTVTVVVPDRPEEKQVMKTIASALIALSLVFGLVAPASAMTADEIFAQIHRNLP
jgi:hypothetical protein